MITTTDLAQFGNQERTAAIELLTAWEKYGLPVNFEASKIQIMFNRDFGNVFLTNDKGQVAILEDNKLMNFYTTPGTGKEGTLSELLEDFDKNKQEWHYKDIEYLKELIKDLDFRKKGRSAWMISSS